MSEQTSGRRRIAARVVPIARIIPSALTSNQPSRTAPQDSAVLRGLPGRSRAYGAPLAAPTRFVRPAHQVTQTVFQDVMTAAAAVIWSHVGRLPEGRGEVDEVDADLAGEVSPLILWEQPPQPQDRAQARLPRWVGDVSLVPNEQEFSELSAYLVFLIDSFARFCSAPEVIESGCWQARLPMPPAVLPETTLDLNLSPLLVGLRVDDCPELTHLGQQISSKSDPRD